MSHLPTLRAIEPADAAAVHVLTTHPDVARTLGGTPADTEDGWKKRISEAAADRTLLLGAFVSTELAGLAMLDGFPHVRRRHVASLAVAVAPSFWRRGIGEHLVRAAVDAADRWWGYVRIELGVHADHAAAIALYEKYGFVVETRRPRDMLRDGVLVDGLGMARLRPGFTAPPAIGDSPPIPPRGARAAVVVRPRRKSDAEAFARLHETASVVDGTFQLPFQTTLAWERRFESTLPGSHVLAAEVNGEVVGATGLFPLGPSPRMRHAADFGMSVRPDAQGRGVGEALMRAVTDLSDRWLGLERLVLEVYVDNDRARALYERHGFVIEGVQRAMGFRRGTYADAYAMGRLRRSA